MRYIYTSIKHYKTTRYENDPKFHYLRKLADTETASEQFHEWSFRKRRFGTGDIYSLTKVIRKIR